MSQGKKVDEKFMYFAMTAVCIQLLIAGAAAGSDTAGFISDNEYAADGNEGVKDSNGPTIMLSYNKEPFGKNPISSFMYFVPLISTTLVDSQASADNEQKVDIFLYKKTVDSKSFHISCEFEMLGKGFYRNTFDSAGMIAAHIDGSKKGETLTNMLDYIKFEGEGIGRLDVKGTISGSTRTVTEVNMQFNVRGRKSPVTIGLYDIKPQGREYKYENRTNQIIARVNALTFRKSEKNPRLGIKIAAINNKTEKDDLFSGVRAVIASLFIKPPNVDKLGNDTILDFGHALFQQSPSFTFPKAKNIKENKILAKES